ncbi:hypothetical protein ACRYCC_29600 [Actinomadura scrupuli]|uniref:hypothetical protein n=1 Tax=Actinomadura scrupuli TaxID=559629 RepID=UPI003D968E03
MKEAVRLVGVLVLAAGPLLAAGCGGGGGGPGPTRAAGAASPGTPSAAPSGTAPGQAPVPLPKGETGAGGGSAPVLSAHSRFAACLEREGIPLSAVKQPALSPRQQIAVRKCGAYLPGGLNSGVLSAVQKFRTCMNKHGAPLPAANRPFVLRTEDPKVAAAVKACTSLLPSTGGTT